MRQRLRCMIRKEFIQTLREPRMRVMLFLPPLIQLLIFGFAVNLDVDSRAHRLDGSGPHAREPRVGVGVHRLRAVRDRADASRRKAKCRICSTAAKWTAWCACCPGFARDVERGRSTSVQVLLDGTNSNTASIVSGYAGQTIVRYSSEVMDQQQRQKLVAGTMASNGPIPQAVPQVDAQTRVWFNPDLHSRNYFIPGVIVNIITLVTLSLTAMAIVREKEIGTMEQLMVTPIRPVELILGQDAAVRAGRILGHAAGDGRALLMFHVPFAATSDCCVWPRFCSC